MGIVTTVRSLEDRIPLRAKESFGEMQNPSKKSNALLEETSLEVMSSNPGARDFFSGEIREYQHLVVEFVHHRSVSCIR